MKFSGRTIVLAISVSTDWGSLTKTTSKCWPRATRVDPSPLRDGGPGTVRIIGQEGCSRGEGAFEVGTDPETDPQADADAE